MSDNKKNNILTIVGLLFIIVSISIYFIKDLSLSNIFKLASIDRNLAQLSESLSQGLIHHWTFDSDVLDSAGANNGTVSGTETHESGRVDQSLSFDGVNNQVSVGQIYLSSAFSISAWFKIDGDGPQYYQYIIGRSSGDGSMDNYGLASMDANTIRFKISACDVSCDTYLDITATNHRNGNWHQVVSIYDGTDMEVYFDGVSKGTLPRTGGIANNNAATYIGAYLDGYGRLNGNIDDIRMYDRALTQSEIEELYTSAGGFIGPDTVGPTVSITSPANGDPAKIGTITLTADASDDRGVAGVQFKIDGSNIGSEDITAPYSVDLDTTSYSNSSHSIVATARDDGGNSTDSTGVTITIANPDETPPTVSSPLPTGVLSRNATTANLRVTTNEFATCKYGTVQNTAYESITNTFSTTGGTSHSQTVNVSESTSYSYYVRCADSFGNANNSDTTINFTVPAPPPEGQEIIDAGALIDLPTGALWSKGVNFQPGDLETVTVNPPVFSWTYTPDPSKLLSDTHPYIFLFQAAYSQSDLQNQTNLAVNILTRSNTYNFLDHFTSGSTVYWRVGYAIDTELESNISNGLPRYSMSTTSPSLLSEFQSTVSWTNIRSFTIGSNAAQWDRGMFSDEAYLNSKSHPRILFNNGNKSSFSSYIRSLPDWSSFKTNVDDHLSDSNYWNTSYMTVVNSHSYNTGGILASTAFIWQMTGDQDYLNNLSPTPQEVLVSFANSYITTGAFMEDPDTQGRGGEIYYIGLAYDWLYDEMTTEQKNAVMNVLELHSKWSLYGVSYFNNKNVCSQSSTSVDDPTNGLYPGYRCVPLGSVMKKGESHTSVGLFKYMVGAMAGYSEGNYSRMLLDMTTNQMIGKPMWNTVEGLDGGNYVAFYQSMTLGNLLRTQSVFPEMHFENNPFFKNSVSWITGFRPVGTETEIINWGDPNEYGGGWNVWAFFGKALAYITQDKTALDYYNADMAIDSSTDFNAFSVNDAAAFEKKALNYYFPNIPTVNSTQALSKVFPLSGWAFTSSLPTNTDQGFKNGVGFTFATRPGGQSISHWAESDISYELWAYGQTITENGALNWAYNKLAENHNSLLINGTGPNDQSTNYNIIKDIFARIFAFKTSSTNLPYTYVAGDVSKAYHLYYENPSTGYNYWNLSVNKAYRHVLMIKNKYFIIFDDIGTSVPAKFTSVYHVLDDPLIKTENNTSFNYTKVRSEFFDGNLSRYSFYNPTPVKVFVSEIAHKNDGNLEIVYRNGPDQLSVNPINNRVIGDATNRASNCYENRTLTCSDARKNSVWVSNADPATSFNFMKVIYPKNPADSALPDPVIERLDDYTARVTNPDGTVDIISFDATSGDSYSANLIVDVDNIIPPSIPTGGYSNIVVNPPPTVYTFTITKTGSGTITSNPTGIICGPSTCSYSTTVSGQSVTLTATPSNAYEFTGWGGICSGTGTCTTTMSTNRSATATFTSTGGDVTAPTVTAFTIPSTASSLTVSISSFTATDAVGVTGYKITESSTAPAFDSSGWTVSTPSSYTFATEGSKTLYAWAKDAAGNVSASLNDSVVITLPPSDTAPTVTASTPSSITQTGAILNGNITSTGGVNPTIRGFEYGTTLSYGTIVSTTGSYSTGAYTSTLSSLSCGTTYNFRSFAQNTVGTASSSNQSFSTSACSDVTAPTTPTSLNGTNINQTSFTLLWTGSTDASGIAGYKIYQDAVLIHTTTGVGTSYNVTGLTANTTYVFTVKAVDSSSNSNESNISQSVSITTSANVVTNSIPVLASISSQTVDEGSLITFTISATDADINDTLSYSVVSLPTGATFNPSTRTFTWTPSNTQSGIYTPTFIVSDGNGGADAETVILNIVDVPATDLCSNIDGVQETIPSGMTANGTTCSTPNLGGGGGGGGGGGSSSFDYCYNISGTQSSVPTGYTRDNIGNCTTQTASTTLATTTNTIVQPTYTTYLPITKWLTLGMIDGEVKLLQQILNKLNYTVSYSGLGSKGNESTYFGPATEKALRSFQCAILNVCSGTPTTTGYGATGPKTRTALSQKTTNVVTTVNTPTVQIPVQQIPVVSNTNTTTKLGSITKWLVLETVDSQVKTLQQILNSLGYIIATSGSGSKGQETTYFGISTQKALQSFQCKVLNVCNGTPTTTGYGATGPKTRNALNSISIGTTTKTNATSSPIKVNTVKTSKYTFTRSLTLGDTGEDVRQLQIFLNSRGFIISPLGIGSPGNETTYFGPATQSALIRYQRANNITPASGFFGPVTRGVVEG